MRRLAFCMFVLGSVVLAFAMTLGACGDSCVDTGCVQIDAGPDVKEAGKKDAAKDVATDVTSDGETDAASDAAEAGGDASGDATTE